MKDIDVIYLYEKAARELDVACIVKYLAEKTYGMSVEIIQQNYCYPEAFRRFRPRIVVLPFCYQERSHNIYLLKLQHAIFFNLAWEQILYHGNRMAKTPRGKFAVKHVIHHSWSNFYAKYLVEQGVPPEHIFINGNPTYALYEEPYLYYFSQRNALSARYGLNRSKRWVFFPENYNWAFYDEAMLRQMVNDGQKPDDITSMREFCTKSFETVMGWCKELVSSTDLELIIRPRPATTEEEFRKRMGEVIGTIPENIHIIKGETVREWIVSSDIIVSSYSTSLVEAAFAGKPAYMLEPYPIPNLLRQHWFQFAHRATAFPQFLNICASPVSVQSNEALRNWARSDAMTGGNTIQNIVDYLKKILDRKVPVPSAPTLKSIHLPIQSVKYNLPWWATYAIRKAWIEVVKYRKNMAIDADYQYDVDSMNDIPKKLAMWDAVLSTHLGGNREKLKGEHP